MDEAPPIRDAASVVLLRDARSDPKVLMGQRGKSAAFMPNKYVFPGGAVDVSDGAVPLAELPDTQSMARLGLRSPDGLAHAIVASAIREVWEETGLRFGTQGAAPGPSTPDWDGFYATGLRPSAQGFQYFFRAITPPMRPRRFDARFFLVPAIHYGGGAGRGGGIGKKRRRSAISAVLQQQHRRIRILAPLLISTYAIK